MGWSVIIAEKRFGGRQKILGGQKEINFLAA